jgi:hypothetical protein
MCANYEKTQMFPNGKSTLPIQSLPSETSRCIDEKQILEENMSYR